MIILSLRPKHGVIVRGLLQPDRTPKASHVSNTVYTEAKAKALAAVNAGDFFFFLRKLDM